MVYRRLSSMILCAASIFLQRLGNCLKVSHHKNQVTHPLRFFGAKNGFKLPKAKTLLSVRIPNKYSTTTSGLNVSTKTNAPDHLNNNILTERHKSISCGVVAIRKGRQSMAFREGSPLIFPGSISYTYKYFCENNGGCGENLNTDLQLQKEALANGDFVAVEICDKADKHIDNRKKGNRNSGDSKTSPYPHFLIDVESRPEQDEGSNNSVKIPLLSGTPKIIGFGIYNPFSMYRVRILCHQTSHPSLFREIKETMTSSSSSSPANRNKSVLRLILGTKIREAIQSRKFIGLPSSNFTDSFRLLNGEGDGLSGLAVDMLGGNVAVVMSSATWCEIYKDDIVDVLDASLREAYFNVETVTGNEFTLIWRKTSSRLEQDGYSPNIAACNSRLHEGVESTSKNINENEKRFVLAMESGIQYKIYPWSGQKTGFYCDQRDNRIQIANLCKGKRVLDLCCYSGGFTLNALKGGASLCVGVDSSQDAINSAMENAEINHLEDGCTFIREDLSKFLRDSNEHYDVVILDPPKLAPKVSDLERASRKYRALNRDAFKMIDPIKGGLLLTCTCSGAMTQKDGGQYFLQIVKSASISAKRSIQLLRINGPASCHTQCPSSFPAGAYLTAALFYVSPVQQ